jgi:hypothetical protein
VKYPDGEAQARIRMALNKVFLELDVDPNDVDSMLVGVDGITFTLTVPMPVAPIGP